MSYQRYYNEGFRDGYEANKLDNVEVWVVLDPYDRTIEGSFWSEEEADEYVEKATRQNARIGYYKMNVTPDQEDE